MTSLDCPVDFETTQQILNLPSCDLVTFELLDLLANVERKQRVAPALQALGDVLDYQGHHADVVAGVTAILADAQVKDKTQKAFGDVKLDRSDPLMRFKKEHTCVCGSSQVLKEELIRSIWQVCDRGTISLLLGCLSGDFGPDERRRAANISCAQKPGYTFWSFDRNSTASKTTRKRTLCQTLLPGCTTVAIGF